jgi:CubicO group peptidase (beta-lactamase class C family)
MHAMPRRRVLRHALLWTVAGVAGCATTPSAWARVLAADEISERERAAMAATAEGFRRKYAVPGLSVAIARKGRHVYQEAFGVGGRVVSAASPVSNRERRGITLDPEAWTGCRCYDGPRKTAN